jgi:hypothetical protein
MMHTDKGYFACLLSLNLLKNIKTRLPSCEQTKALAPEEFEF